MAAAIAAAEADIVLILGASATSDVADTCPAALVLAGGRLIRFGMPVDPGNLLFLGEHDHRPVVGLPGCARSPALNGADWVLERLAAGLAVSSVDIGQMGVGGLLKEIASRPQPRVGRPRTSTPPRVTALVLAAGSGAAYARGRDKLLEVIDGRPLLRTVAEAALTRQPCRLGRGRAAAGFAGPHRCPRRPRGRHRRGAGLGRGNGRLRSAPASPRPRGPTLSFCCSPTCPPSAAPRSTG